ncbi:relaxase family protein [Helicobacter bizzozeronii]|uniref:relaxase/mobilization nuclease domain-containing protein n=2 Tax=Helicobacter bizzozeronii TaxID=56877 RepID=UPI000CEEDE94|nr:relaxase/mobilization nuclease domain-containing protein [Helicobacter bizzozeronii]
MLVKFFRKHKGSKSDGTACIDYLLNQRVQQGTAKLLKGNPKDTKALIRAIPRECKLCAGCLSFEERNIDESLKQEIMQSFEQMLMTEVMADRYDILWVEHTDKDRLELNFVIPCVDLISLERLVPFFAKVDLLRVDAWKDYINAKYHLSDPKAFEKQRDIVGINTKTPQGKMLYKSAEELQQVIVEAVSSGTLSSKAQIVEQLIANGYEIMRNGKQAGKGYLGIKPPGAPRAFRLKGVFYDERFTNTQSLGKLLKEYSASPQKRAGATSTEPNRSGNKDHREHSQEHLATLAQRLKKHIEYKHQFYVAKFAEVAKTTGSPTAELGTKPREQGFSANSKCAQFDTRAGEQKQGISSETQIMADQRSCSSNFSHYGNSNNGFSDKKTEQGFAGTDKQILQSTGQHTATKTNQSQEVNSVSEIRSDGKDVEGKQKTWVRRWRIQRCSQSV